MSEEEDELLARVDEAVRYSMELLAEGDAKGIKMPGLRDSTQTLIMLAAALRRTLEH